MVDVPSSAGWRPFPTSLHYNKPARKSVVCLFTPSCVPNSAQHMADMQMMLGRQAEPDCRSGRRGAAWGRQGEARSERGWARGACVQGVSPGHREGEWPTGGEGPLLLWPWSPASASGGNGREMRGPGRQSRSAEFFPLISKCAVWRLGVNSGSTPTSDLL